MLRYEKTLLRRVLRGGGQVRLSDLSQKTARAAMGKVYTQLGRILGARLSPAGPDEDLPPAEDETMATLRAFCGFLRDLDPAAETDPWTAFGDYLPYAIAFQLMPAWGERFAMLTPPGHLGADRFWSDASWVSGNNLTWAGALAGFTTAVCSHVPPVGPVSHQAARLPVTLVPSATTAATAAISPDPESPESRTVPRRCPGTRPNKAWMPCSCRCYSMNEASTPYALVRVVPE